MSELSEFDLADYFAQVPEALGPATPAHQGPLESSSVPEVSVEPNAETLQASEQEFSRMEELLRGAFRELGIPAVYTLITGTLWGTGNHEFAIAFAGIAPMLEAGFRTSAIGADWMTSVKKSYVKAMVVGALAVAFNLASGQASDARAVNADTPPGLPSESIPTPTQPSSPFVEVNVLNLTSGQAPETKAVSVVAPTGTPAVVNEAPAQSAVAPSKMRLASLEELGILPPAQ